MQKIRTEVNPGDIIVTPEEWEKLVNATKWNPEAKAVLTNIAVENIGVSEEA